ncbi:MAG TPA: outer membrane beta-barrel protein [Bacteriovoracaceae bacterium]|nr:outer membrane beta-barrel protein [Bacteriovoracaceae bacterium]
MYRLALIALLTISTTLHAQSKIGVMASFLYNGPEIDTNADDINEESEIGYGIGMRALVPLTSGLNFRTGAGFIEKNVSYEVDFAGTKSGADLSFLYLNIPLTLYLSGLDEKFGVFGGTAIQALLSDDCETKGVAGSCRNIDEKTLVFPIVLGFDFSFTQTLSMELSYEYGVTHAAKDLKINSAVLSLVWNLQ